MAYSCGGVRPRCHLVEALPSVGRAVGIWVFDLYNVLRGTLAHRSDAVKITLGQEPVVRARKCFPR